MDLRTLLKQGITFGPFKTEHHRRTVSPEFQEALFRHIAEKIVPDLTIVTDSVEGTVEALYDDDKYHGPHSRVKFKYRFEGRFRQGGRRENVSFPFEVEPGAPGFRFVFGEPQILTAREFERMDEQREAEERQQDREAAAVLLPGEPLAGHWEACAAVWKTTQRVVSEVLGPRGFRPLAHHLCERFAALHPDAEPFFLDKLKDPDPVLAAYAFKCWIRMAAAEKGRIPPEVLARKDPISTHMGCFVSEAPLGEWMSDYWNAERG